MRQDRKWVEQFGRYSGLAMALPASTFVGYAIGYYLDKWLGTTFLSIVFLILGMVSGMAHLIRELTREKP